MLRYAARKQHSLVVYSNHTRIITPTTPGSLLQPRRSCYFNHAQLLLQPRRRHVLDFGVALAHMRCGWRVVGFGSLARPMRLRSAGGLTLRQCPCGLSGSAIGHVFARWWHDNWMPQHCGSNLAQGGGLGAAANE